MIGKLICLLTKHKRGKQVSKGSILLPGAPWEITYECPRCKAQWTRKRKVKA